MLRHDRGGGFAPGRGGGERKKATASPLVGQIRSGTATGVGVAAAAGGSGRGSLRLSGVFTFDGRLDLVAPGAKVTILNGLDAGGSGGELVLDSQLALAAEGPEHGQDRSIQDCAGPNADG